jgi:hypothetical protein
LTGGLGGGLAWGAPERLIGRKTNEVPEFQPLLRGLEIAGCVLTMDAAHTVRAHAAFICEELLAHYVMIVKENQKGCSRCWRPVSKDLPRRAPRDLR